MMEDVPIEEAFEDEQEETNDEEEDEGSQDVQDQEQGNLKLLK